MSTFLRTRSVLLALAVALIFSGCDLLDPRNGGNGGGSGDGSGSFRVTIENVSTASPILEKGVFNTPIGATSPAPIFPGEAYEFSFTATRGSHLSLATMFVQSNDLYYAFEAAGLPLWGRDGRPVTGDVTDRIFLYDAGTEVNETPGEGANQAPRQSGPNTGADENGNISLVPTGLSYPDTDDVINVSLAYDAGTFTVRIENRSDANTLATSTGTMPVPLSPGLWVVHTEAVQLYTLNAPASAGIEYLAEDGNPAFLDAELDDVAGVTVPLSPGAWVVHSDAIQLFETGEAASRGLEYIAEDGMPSFLVDALQSVEAVRSVGVFNTPVGADGPAPIGPGGSYSFEFDAEQGDRLSFATMFIQSNDLFYGFRPEGLSLFDADGFAVEGNVTQRVYLYDAGTEVDEEPGVGPNQAPRQSGPNTGTDENGAVIRVEGSNDGFSYPSVRAVIRVTVEVL